MTSSEPDPRRVFVVHGRNRAARKAMFDFLRSIDLQPIEWEQAVQATGKASPYIGDVLDAGFAIARAVVVLMTPDDEARLLPEFQGDDEPAYEVELTPQARPNVLFEAGMALGRHEDRTVLVEFGTLRPFSDVIGRHTVRMDGSSEKRQILAKRLENAGCKIDLTGTEWHKAGDFTIAATAATKLNNPVKTPSTTTPSNVTGHSDFGGKQSGRSSDRSPTTIIVDQSGGGDHRTIAAAIQAAAAGDRIVIKPGRYLESVRINKPIEVVGQGERSNILISSSNRPAIIIDESGVTVSNLTINCSGGDRDSAAIVIGKEHAIVETCDISTDGSRPCIYLRSSSATIRNNTLHQASYGISIHSCLNMVIDNNEIKDNASSGIDIFLYVSGIIKNNVITRNGEYGIYVNNGNREIVVSDNDLRGNKSGPLEVHWSMEPRVTLLRNMTE